MRWRPGWRSRTPSMVRVLVPMPEIWAPSVSSMRQSPCTWGSQAALRMMLRPEASTAAIRMFSVPVTEGSSRKISAPFRPGDEMRIIASNSTVAPSAVKPPKWVSSRRRPMTSPPGGERVVEPKRASSGPANKIEARSLRQRSAGASPLATPPLLISTVFAPSHWWRPPMRSMIWSMMSTSSMRGTLSSVTV